MELTSPRSLTWLGFYGLILIAWVSVFQMAACHGRWPCDADGMVVHSGAGFPALYAMWSIMMAAMMLPTIVPTLRIYDDFPVAAGAGQVGWIALVAGYGTVWLVGAVVFAGAQVLAQEFSIVAMSGAATSWWVSAALFLVAGAWQFSRTKAVCQDACLSPMQYFMTGWRPGIFGGWRMGIDIGLACVGCCWAIMALGFVGGMTNLWWMGLATGFMVLEKLPEIGQRLRRPVGFVLILTSCYSILRGLGWI